MTFNFSGSSDTPATAYVCLAGGNPWYQPQTVDLTQYKSIDFDIKYDPTSDITIPEFNNLSTWPANLTNSTGANVFQSWASAGYLSGSTAGVDVFVCGPNNQMAPLIVNTNLPAAAANGWVHMSIPINATESGISDVNGIVFHKWINQNWGIQNNAVARIWVDNIVLKGTAGPPPPPKLALPAAATPGFNAFATTEGNSFYDRQNMVLRQASGLSWVGHATPSNPVSYSFTINSFPQAPATYGAEAFMFLVPNPAYQENAPDWNETNCIVAAVAQGSSTATMTFQYKVNSPYGNAMYYAAGNLGKVVSAGTAVGTWTINFTSDTNVALTGPDGTTTNLVIPATNAVDFAESSGFNVYIGMQANNAATINKAVTFASFAVSNTAAPYSENFLTDTALDTVNTWNTSVAGGPSGLLVVPSGPAEWLSWTLPDTGFSLQVAPTLTNPFGWTSPTLGPLIPMFGARAQLVSSSELPAGNAAFFELVKRTATQLQVLLPGETNAPNTPSGKTGTPTPESVGSFFTVTVNAVDSTYHIVSSTDAINLASTTDASAPSAQATLAGGTAQVTFSFDSAGSQTVTASDTTSTNITSAVSSTVTAE